MNKKPVAMRINTMSALKRLSPVFIDPLQVAFYDPAHSDDEDREILIGHSNQNRLLLVVYTLRKDAIRIISARPATRREVKDYEKGI